jgi:hypothetical protein
MPAAPRTSQGEESPRNGFFFKNVTVAPFFHEKARAWPVYQEDTLFVFYTPTNPALSRN